MRLFIAALLLSALSACGPFESWDPSYGDKAEERVNRGVSSLNGQSERDLLGRFGDPRDRYDYADGGRRLTWRVRQSNDRRFWCELIAEIDSRGQVSKAGWRYSGNIGGMRHCDGWLGAG